MGGRAYIPWYGQGVWGFFVAIFMGPFLVTGVAEAEQRRILKKALAQLKQRAKTLSNQNMKQFGPCGDMFLEMADGWDKKADDYESDFAPLRSQIERALKNATGIGKLYPVADELLDACYTLLPVVRQCAKSDAELDKLAKLEKELDVYKAMQFNVGDLITWQQLIDRLRKIRTTFEECIADAKQKTSSAPATADEDYYAILGVDPTATLDEIKDAYRVLQHKYHPDKKAKELEKITDPDVRKVVSDTFDNKAKEINEAFGILSDATKRSEYDKARR